MRSQTCPNRLGNYTKREFVLSEVFEYIQILLGKPKEHAPTQSIKPVAQSLVPEGRPAPGTICEHRSSHNSLLGQRYLSDMGATVGKCPQRQVSIVKIHERHQHEQQNRGLL